MKHLIFAASVALLAGAVSPCAADPAESNFPQRPVRIVVGGSAGGGLDILSRLLEGSLEKSFGKVFTENRPGAGGNIAFAHVAKSAPDGYTLLLTTDGVTAAPSLRPKDSVDPLKDLTPVAQLAETTDALLVRPDSNLNSLGDFIAYAKKRAAEGKPVTIGSPGVGTISHLTGALFGLKAGIDWVHVPYKGGGPAVTGMLGGEIDALWILVAPVGAHVKSGKLRALAVTSAQRNAALPDVPTVAESGLPDFKLVDWIGVMAPAGTPQPVIDKLQSAFQAAIVDPALKDKLLVQGFVPSPQSSKDLAKQIGINVKLWADTVRDAKIAAQ